MAHRFELTITGDIPADNDDLGAQATVDTKAAAHGIVEMLDKLGLKNVRQHRKVVRAKDKVVAGAPVSVLKPHAA